MALPTPSPSQLAALEAMKAVALAGASGAVDKVNAIQGALDKQQEVEDFQKETFDVYNDEILRRYEVERKWIDGQDIASPVIENDIQQFAADGSGRLDNGGDFSPLRIPEFDGGPLTLLEARHELELFVEQGNVLDLLQNGIVGQITLEVGATIRDAITASSTSLIIDDNTNPISNGDKILITGGGFLAIIEVTNYSSGGVCTGEPGGAPFSTNQVDCEGPANGGAGTWTVSESLDFIYIIEPSGTIPAGSDIGQATFNGFNNTERTNKVASNPNLQPLMNDLIGQLHSLFDERKVVLNNQLTEIQANEDDNIDPTAETDVTTSSSAIDGFLGVTPPSTIDVSDAGITAITNERNTRHAQATARPANIAIAITTGDFYNQRFNTSEGRCRLNNGSIVLLNDLQNAKTGAQEGGVEAAGLASRYAALIP